ncbi:histidine kinase [Paractinoplanes abujensis]|uniref:GAF domain-containing protein n=1 Tax=Paractinoplanes abujensis TaxID=882441 RepID=A0A7W7G424_9ACTN|nr:GAF domain-containing protein [Actinoplanes abujensis]MBB4693356.1 GAF domain-containing protein [Actinoplanes abujensis]GID24560.1 histidine kinase [Actinoplanes abujensis]
MIYDLSGHHLLTPADPEIPARMRRLTELGLGDDANPHLDEFAQRVGDITKAPLAMVNFIQQDRQFLGGLYTGATVPAALRAGLAGRTFSRAHGYCPHVVVRRKALVLDDVCDYPRFAGNPVVDEIGIRSYLGAPLIDRTGIALGTVCVVDVEPRPWGRPGLETIKSLAAELVSHIQAREGRD